jgi:hypothetical protein
MKSRFLTILALAATSALLGCDRKSVAVETAPHTPAAGQEEKTIAREASRLSAAVDAYARQPNAENDAAVRNAMAELDSEIAHLEDLVAKRRGREREEVAVQYRSLQAFRSRETTRFASAQAGSSLTPAIERLDQKPENVPPK